MDAKPRLQCKKCLRFYTRHEDWWTMCSSCYRLQKYSGYSQYGTQVQYPRYSSRPSLPDGPSKWVGWEWARPYLVISQAPKPKILQPKIFQPKILQYNVKEDSNFCFSDGIETRYINTTKLVQLNKKGELVSNSFFKDFIESDVFDPENPTETALPVDSIRDAEFLIKTFYGQKISYADIHGHVTIANIATFVQNFMSLARLAMLWDMSDDVLRPIIIYLRCHLSWWWDELQKIGANTLYQFFSSYPLLRPVKNGPIITYPNITITGADRASIACTPVSVSATGVSFDLHWLAETLANHVMDAPTLEMFTWEWARPFLTDSKVYDWLAANDKLEYMPMTGFAIDVVKAITKYRLVCAKNYSEDVVDLLYSMLASSDVSISFGKSVYSPTHKKVLMIHSIKPFSATLYSRVGDITNNALSNKFSSLIITATKKFLSKDNLFVKDRIVPFKEIWHYEGPVNVCGKGRRYSLGLHDDDSDLLWYRGGVYRITTNESVDQARENDSNISDSKQEVTM